MSLQTTQSGGTATLSSKVGEGTSVRAYFPLAEGPPTTKTRAPADERKARGTERILLVEDQPGAMARRILQRLGYQIRTAADGREALAIWLEDGGASIDLIVSDVVMPEMSGPEFVDELRRRGHNPKVLFMSGYAHDALDQLSSDPEDEFIEKPFTPPDLGPRVRELLDEER